MVRGIALAAALLVAATAGAANNLTVDPRTLQMNDLTTITISLEGSFAAADSVNIPLDNLSLVGQPWVSSEFAWINGEVVRRKVFRYRARPLGPGSARVGPLVLTAPDGQRDTFPAIALQVMPDRISESNDPETLLRESAATGRPPLFIVAEATKTEAWVGEQIVVTWYLYNAATVENWQIVSVPKLPDFWIEEIDSRGGVDPDRVFVGDRMMHRVVLRRVALYPLQSGSLHIGGMTIEAAVMQRIRGGPFGSFAGNLVETTFTSATIPISVKPLPPGLPVAAVGEVLLSCELPRQRNAGPVVIEATLAGAANLRAASAPRFAGPVRGRVEVEGGQANVARESGSLLMSRRWRYLIFPAERGMLQIPPLKVTVFSPSAGERRELQCSAATIWSEIASPAAAQVPPPERPDARRRGPLLPWVAGGALAVVFAAVAAPRLRRELALRRDVRAIAAGTPSEVREAVDARLGTARAVALLDEKSERGDAYRALRSLLDALERDRDVGDHVEDEVARRVRDVLVTR